MATLQRTNDVEVLQKNLSTFTRIATALRNQPVRNHGQLDAVEQEINLLRKALGFGEVAWNS